MGADAEQWDTVPLDISRFIAYPIQGAGTLSTTNYMNPSDCLISKEIASRKGMFIHTIILLIPFHIITRAQ